MTLPKRNHTRAIVPYKTRTGVEIGLLYTPPPPQMTRDEERIQAALLGDRGLWHFTELGWMTILGTAGTVLWLIWSIL